ncbi:MAG: hypothetical protein Q9164_007118, partial [Protoblastenia rupestris]
MTDNREGLTILPSSTTPDNLTHQIDLCFVHGLGAKPLDNWHKNGHIWIQDNLPDALPYARVMTFGYNASYTGDATSGRIRDFGKQLLEALRIEREQCQSRPLVFVCHSLGGLVVKRAIVEASPVKSRHFDIFNAASGIVFLATPHRGSSKASIGKMLVNISKVSLKQNKTQLLAELERENPSLTDLTEDFSRLHSHFKIASAYEMASTDVSLFLPKIMIVPPESAKMGIEDEILIPMSASHSSICKFESSNDSSYKQIKGVIDEFIKQGLRKVEKPADKGNAKSTAQPSQDLPPQAVTLMNLLGITETDRLNALKTSETKPLYRSEGCMDLRIRTLRLLRNQPWTTIQEEIIHPDHWWPPVSSETRSLRGAWTTYYPQDTKFAKIVLFIDWHAYESDPYDPQMEWMIETPNSEYHPGKHYGVIHDAEGGYPNMPLGRMRVAWRSPIFSPFVDLHKSYDDSLKSLRTPEDEEDEHTNFTNLFQSIAHILVFGLSIDVPHLSPPPFRFELQNGMDWSHYISLDKPFHERNRDFKILSSFFSRAYNGDIPDESVVAGQGNPSREDCEHIMYAIRTFANFHIASFGGGNQPRELQEAFDGIKTQKDLSIEERRWADK